MTGGFVAGSHSRSGRVRQKPVPIERARTLDATNRISMLPVSVPAARLSAQASATAASQQKVESSRAHAIATRPAGLPR